MAAENSSFELEVVEVAPVNKNACRKRKPNFSVQEIAVITQKFEENQADEPAENCKARTVKVPQGTKENWRWPTPKDAFSEYFFFFLLVQ